MKRKSKEEKIIESIASAAFRRHSDGIQINVLDISKVLDAGRKAAASGGDVDAAVCTALQQYRVN